MSEVRISEKAQWKRPFTVKRYIHPPMSEEVVMMWPDGKIMFEGVDSERYPWEYEASAFKILIGEDNEEIDFKKIKYETRQDGVPVHAFGYLKDGAELRMESFCTVEKSPVSYSRLTFRNKTEEEIRGKYSFILRTGTMVLLMGVEQDGYAHLNTNLGNWGFIPTEFQYENGRVYDKAVTMELFGAEDCALTWVGNVAGIPWRYRGVLQAEIVLPPRGEKDLYIAFYRTGKGHAERDYEKEKKKTEKFWEEELSKIRVYPKTRGKRNDGMYRTLVANSLQMFAYPKGKDYVIPRQGGTQNNIWPAEAVYMLKALDRIGGYSAYTEKVIEFYLEKLYISKGKERGSFKTMSGSIGWASDTAAILETIAWHIYYGTRKDYEKYRGYACESYRWIERKRRTTLKGEYFGKGLFPPMRSCDWAEVKQTWTKTDVFNLQAIRALMKAFEKYKDPWFGKITKNYEEYLNRMKEAFCKIAKANEGKDEIVVPMHLGEKVSDPQTDGPFIADGVNLIVNEVCEAKSEDAYKIEKYYTNRCMFQNGLHGLMNCGLMPGHQWDPWAGHVWYTGFVEEGWFNVFLKQGRKKEAEETLKAQLKYSMTPEYYVCERYCDNDPYFVPWLPNASGNGRLINMLCDFYENKEV